MRARDFRQHVETVKTFCLAVLRTGLGATSPVPHARVSLESIAGLRRLGHPAPPDLNRSMRCPAPQDAARRHFAIGPATPGHRPKPRKEEPVIETKSRHSATDLEHRVDLLATLVRRAPRLIVALRWWLGFEVEWTEREPDTAHHLTEQEALQLDLPVGTEVLRRRGYLVSGIGDASWRLAVTDSLVYLPGLTTRQRHELGSGTSLGRVLGDADRVTHWVARLDTRHDADGATGEDPPVLLAHAAMLRNDYPVALVDEQIFRSVPEHRVPGRLEHFGFALREGGEPR